MSPALKVLLAFGVLAAVCLMAFGGLSYFGFFDSTKQAAKKSREGKVAVPRSMRAIPAFKKVTREDIVSLELGDDSYFWMDRERVEANPKWIRNPSQIIGRVMAKDKREGFVFTEADFLPEGSRTGLSGGIPDDKQGFFIDTEQIPGLRQLRMGDRFDLLASLPDEAQAGPEAEFGLLAGGIKVRAGNPIPLSGVRILVQNGELVALTAGKAVSTTGAQGLPEQTARTRTRSTDTVEATIAIDSEEVVPLTQALAEELTVHCVARSGRRQAKDSEESLRKLVQGMVSFPATAKPLEAFTKITAADLSEPLTGEPRKYYFLPTDANDSWISSIDDLLGRVVSRDIDAGYIFTESDLLTDDATVRPIEPYTRISVEDFADWRATPKLIGRVVARKIDPGSTITEEDLLTEDCTVQAVEAYSRIGAADLADASLTRHLVGRIVGRDIPAGQSITEDDLLSEHSTVRPIKAYTRIIAEDLAGGRLARQWIGRVAARDIDSGIELTDTELLANDCAARAIKSYTRIGVEDIAGAQLASHLVGRVVARAIEAGQEIAESDLLPPNSAVGITGGTPEGRLAISVDAAKIEGIELLGQQDRFHLLASVPVELADMFAGFGGSVKFAGQLPPTAAIQDRATNTVLADGAVVVDIEDSKATIAVKPEEVAGITKAIATGATIFAVASSGRAPNRQTSPTPNEPALLKSDASPTANIAVIETVVGQKRELNIFSKRKRNREEQSVGTSLNSITAE